MGRLTAAPTHGYVGAAFRGPGLTVTQGPPSGGPGLTLT
jgi:hypothetical protein